jgi:acetyl esterase/lipase
MPDFIRRFAPRPQSALLAPFVALIAALPSCAPVDLLNATVPLGDVTVTRDVAYGSDPRQQLDIYRPAQAANAPVIVFFYGGSWDSGSRGEYKFVAAPLARAGFLVIVPDYRLYPQVLYPTFLEDCAHAVAWSFAHAADYGGDPRHLVLAGHSAGAYNAAMLALNPTYLHDAGVSRDQLAGMVGLAGPYDFLPIEIPKVKAIFAPGDDGPVTQPITYVDGHNPPMLLMAGTDDDTVYPRNSTALAARIRDTGGKVEEKLFKGLGHIGLVTAIAPLFQPRAPVLQDIIRFARDPK